MQESLHHEIQQLKKSILNDDVHIIIYIYIYIYILGHNIFSIMLLLPFPLQDYLAPDSIAQNCMN